MATLLFGYDVESNDTKVTRSFIDRAEAIHTRLGAPCTFFLVGQTLEQNADRLRELKGNPNFEFQSHTFSHKLLKTVCQDDGEKVTVFPGVTVQEAEQEIRRANESLQRELGVTCLGLTGPYNYYRGLADRPDLLDIVHRHGIRYLRTYGRNENDWQPVSLELQPSWYTPQGYPDILECNINGWQDCIKREYYGWANREDYLQAVKRDLDHVAANNLVFSYAQHDWSSIRGDDTMWITEGILQYALEIGIRTVTYSDFYMEKVGERNKQAV